MKKFTLSAIDDYIIEQGDIELNRSPISRNDYVLCDGDGMIVSLPIGTRAVICLWSQSTTGKEIDAFIQTIMPLLKGTFQPLRLGNNSIVKLIKDKISQKNTLVLRNFPPGNLGIVERVSN